MCVFFCFFVVVFFTVKEIIASEIMELLINEVLLKLLAELQHQYCVVQLPEILPVLKFGGEMLLDLNMGLPQL